MDNLYNIVNTLNKKLNKFKYGLIIKGKQSKTMTDDYKTLTIKDMDKYQTGICWDFVNYQHYMFKKYGLKDDSYFFIMQRSKNPNDIVTHTFSIVTINGKHYWFESSWGGHTGLHEVNSFRDVVYELVKQYDKDAKNKPFEVYKYNPDNTINVSNSQFFDRACKTKVMKNESSIFDECNFFNI